MLGLLVQSLMRIPWNLSMQGMKQVTRYLLPDEQVNSIMKNAFALSDRLQRGLVFEALMQSTQTVETMAPGEVGQLAWREFRNKLQAYGAYEYVETSLQISRGADINLLNLVLQTEKLDPYMAVWVTEGIGHYYAEQQWKQGYIPQNLLLEEHLDDLPERSLIVLHAGMGLSFAEHQLRLLSTRRTGADIRRVIQKFIELCVMNSRPGYKNIAIEALGLVARTLFPHLLSDIDREIKDMDLGLLALFWHGVGRGLYFLPIHFIPQAGTGRRALEMALSEPPHRSGRLNAVAGMAWPLTLVNIRHPYVMESFLKESPQLLVDSDAFSQGVSTAVMTWFESTSDDPALQAFITHRPSNLALISVWNRHIHMPSQNAMDNHFPKLKAQNRLDDLFRYTPLARLIENT
jgi:hypothetical protein